MPVFLFAPLGGVAADRFSRHRVVIATQVSAMILALTYATLILTNRITIKEIFVLASLLGVVNAFDIPARQAFMVEMVGREDLMNAIALNSSLFNGARIVGPAVAGMLIAKIGEGWCFFANGVSYVAVITGLLMMRLPNVERRRSRSQTGHIIEGFRFVRNNTPIRDILLLLGVISLVAMPYAVLMPILADRILHGGARGLGILMGATGVGALLAALTLAARSGLRGLGRFVGVAAVCFGVILIAFSQSKIFLLSV
ncbi:MAG: MFS transporter, partial [Terriglobales bacterium]